MKTQGFWSQERPQQFAFVEKYREMIQKARKGEVGIKEAYDFHMEHKFYSYKYPSVVLQVLKTQGWEKASRELLILLQREELKREELGHLRILFGVKYYYAFKNLDSWHFQKEIEEESQKIKEMINIEKKRRAFT